MDLLYKYIIAFLNNDENIYIVILILRQHAGEFTPSCLLSLVLFSPVYALTSPYKIITFFYFVSHTMSESKAYLSSSSTGTTALNSLSRQIWLVLALVVLAVAGRLLRSFYSTWHHAQKARSIGCGEPPVYPGRDPFGISILLETLEAAREKLLPQLAERRMAFLSRQHDRYVFTFRMCQAGRQNLFTADPKNIQAMLATQFKDFGLGDTRRNVADPVVGHGIVSASPASKYRFSLGSVGRFADWT